MSLQIKSVYLGSNNLVVSPIGLGCMGMSECYGAADDNESIKTIHRAYEIGVTHFDTADSYGFGRHNELLLGKAIKSLDRDKLVIATKCGFERAQNDPDTFVINNNPDYIKKCCEDSLKYLNLDYIDLFYLHRINPDTPIEVSMQALAELVQEGKIRNIGLSEVSARTIAKAHAIHPIAAIQSEYSLWSREAEQEVIPLCKSLGIGFVAFSPIGRGFFSGKIKTIDVLAECDARRYFPRFEPQNISTNLFLISVLEEIAKNKNCTPTQIALAWVLAKGDHIAAIPGTKRITYLEENVNAMNTKLSKEDIELLEKKIPYGSISGLRMPESFAKFSNH